MNQFQVEEEVHLPRHKIDPAIEKRLAAAPGVTDLIRSRTGLPLDAYFSATKVRWILDNVPGAAQRARAETPLTAIII